ncbi:hypothetical protein ACIRJR_17890 [Streptomyces sp. NPDC102402]|uniref:hypothetical protein n=1 Tax=Streptomyces sp. NPDC102402 TaxID=3366169 RepID=UPI00382CE62C
MGIASAPANEVRERRRQHASATTDEGTTDEAAAGSAADALRPAGSPGDEVPGETTDSPSTPSGGRTAPRASTPSTGPVFVDLTGRRSRTWRRAGTVAALCCACYAATLVATLIGSDAGAPFLRLPRAMGLDRETGPRPAPAADGGRSASPSPEASPGAADGTAGTGTLAAAGPSWSAEPHSEPRRASAGPSDIPVVDAERATPPRASASGPPAPGPGSGGSPTAEPSHLPGTGAGSEPPADDGDDAQVPEPEETSSGRGPLGDLVGGLLGGLLGGV